MPNSKQDIPDLSGVSPVCDQFLKIIPKESGNNLYGIYFLGTKNANIVVGYMGTRGSSPNTPPLNIQLAGIFPNPNTFNPPILYGRDDSSNSGVIVLCNGVWGNWVKVYVPNFSQISCLATSGDTLYCSGKSKGLYFQIAKISIHNYSANWLVNTYSQFIDSTLSVDNLIVNNSQPDNFKIVFSSYGNVYGITNTDSFSSIITGNSGCYGCGLKLKQFGNEVYVISSSNLSRFSMNSISPNVNSANIGYSSTGGMVITDVMTVGDTIYAIGSDYLSGGYSSSGYGLATIYNFDSTSFGLNKIYTFGDQCYISAFFSSFVFDKKFYLAGYDDLAFTNGILVPNWYANNTASKPYMVIANQTDL